MAHKQVWNLCSIPSHSGAGPGHLVENWLFLKLIILVFSETIDQTEENELSQSFLDQSEASQSVFEATRFWFCSSDWKKN